MYEEIPEWLRPFMRTDAYIPQRQFLHDLVPQSRIEAILKFGFLSLTPSAYLYDSENQQFFTSDNRPIVVG